MHSIKLNSIGVENQKNEGEKKPRRILRYALMTLVQLKIIKFWFVFLSFRSKTFSSKVDKSV